MKVLGYKTLQGTFRIAKYPKIPIKEYTKKPIKNTIFKSLLLCCGFTDYWAIGTIILCTLKATAHEPAITANLLLNNFIFSISNSGLFFYYVIKKSILMKLLVRQYTVKTMIPIKLNSPSFIMSFMLFRFTITKNIAIQIRLVHWKLNYEKEDMFFDNRVLPVALR